MVGNDWCVRWKNRWLQIRESAVSAGLAGKRVTVKELSGGRLLVQRGTIPLDFKELTRRPTPRAAGNGPGAADQQPPLEARPGPPVPPGGPCEKFSRSRNVAATPQPQHSWTAACFCKGDIST